jgi:predicted transcriptional regulator
MCLKDGVHRIESFVDLSLIFKISDTECGWNKNNKISKFQEHVDGLINSDMESGYNEQREERRASGLKSETVGIQEDQTDN